MGEDQGVVRADVSWPAGTSAGIADFHEPPGPPRRKTFLLGVVTGALLAALVAAGFHRLTASAVTIRNDTGSAVHRVVLEGQGVWEWIGDMGPGASATVRVHPRGESHYVLSFMRENGAEERHEFGYYTGGSYTGDSFEIRPIAR